MKKTRQTLRYPALLLLLLAPCLLSGCIPVVAVREVIYRPSPSDPYDIWGAYITDSGLLLLCGSVDNGQESMDRVVRYYNLALRLEEAPDPLQSDAIQVVQINGHPSLETIKGYLSDLCQFDEKRATKRPEETGWTDIFMNNWDEGFVKLYPADLEAGHLPTPPAEPRVVLFRVYDSDPPQYLLMGRLREGGPEQTVLLILGSEHIEEMW
ncbi:MAG: hypothetical protein PVF47_19785 [Anaerolineae bacterium]|jgi:hypothetical protein